MQVPGISGETLVAGVVELLLMKLCWVERVRGRIPSPESPKNGRSPDQ